MNKRIKNNINPKFTLKKVIKEWKSDIAHWTYDEICTEIIRIESIIIKKYNYELAIICEKLEDFIHYNGYIRSKKDIEFEKYLKKISISKDSKDIKAFKEYNDNKEKFLNLIYEYKPHKIWKKNLKY